MSDIGLQRKTVAIVPYNKRWPILFEKEKKNLEKIFGEVIAIEHVGSTAIEGLAAKPLIDMLVGVKSLKDNKKLIKRGERAGYHWRPKWSRPDQEILFAKGNEKSRTHYIHVVTYKGKRWNDTINFRNYLRTHPRRRKQYELLKKELARKHADDRPVYTEKKTKFVTNTLKMAKKSKVSA